MFIAARASKKHNLFLWDIASFFRLSAKDAITMFLSDPFVKTRETEGLCSSRRNVGPIMHIDKIIQQAP